MTARQQLTETLEGTAALGLPMIPLGCSRFFVLGGRLSDLGQVNVPKFG